jgi:N-acetylmuramoyl-L-alanine amidase
VFRLQIRRGPFFFVSIHYNSSPSPEAHGIEIFYHSGSDNKKAKQSREVAASVLKELVSQTHALSRGVKNGNFHVIRETTMPAILVEGGFMTNIIERSNLRDKKYLDQIAKGVALGIDKHLKKLRERVAPFPQRIIHYGVL